MGEERCDGKKRYVQIRNPKTSRWVLIDREAGSIINHKDTRGAYPYITKWRRSEKKGAS